MRQSRFLRAEIIVFVVFALAANAFAQTKSVEQRIDGIFAPWNKKDTPGASVAVIRDGKMIFSKGYGMANLEYGVPNKPETVFHIASVSKQFTTFAVLLLEEDGKLSLDDDIRKYVPEVPDFGKKITLRHLAHHTSGLRDQWALIALAGGRLDDVITTEHILKLVKRQKELNFEPGNEYLYSNTGYTLLAEVVARVSGKSFAEFTSERIFKPLKMNKTLFYDDHEKIVKNRAYSYYRSPNGYRKAVLSYANAGATSLFTTVEDLGLWALNFENPVVGTKETIARMRKKGVLNNSTEISYALGQSVGTYRGEELISHSGADAGYRSYLARIPKKRLSVAVFSNDGSFNSTQTARRVLDVFLGVEISDTSPVTKPAVKTPPAKEFVVDEKVLNQYVGRYELNPALIIEITKENGKLFGQATGQPKLPLNATSEVDFSVTGVPAKIKFLRSKTGSVQGLSLDFGGGIQKARKLTSENTPTKSFDEYTGYFYSDELATGYWIVLENGGLIARHSRTSDISLRATKRDAFVSNAWFFGQVEFVRNSKNEIEGFRLSNGRVRNLLFEKRN